MVAIVRYVYDRRSHPQVGAAFPLIKNEYEVILMTEERRNIIQSNNVYEDTVLIFYSIASR